MLVEVSQVLEFLGFIEGDSLSRSSEFFLKSVQLSRLQSALLREFDSEIHVEIAILESILEERHTLASNCMSAIIRNILSRGSSDLQNRAIQVLDFEVHTGECFQQGDLLFNVKIGTLTFENIVLLNLDLDVQITSNDARSFIGFTCELIDVLIRYTRFNGNFHFLFIINDLLAIASLASIGIFHKIALAFTLFANLLTLAVSIWTHAHHLNNDLLSLAYITDLGVLASLAFAGFASALALVSFLDHFTREDFFQCHSDINQFSLGFSLLVRTLTTTAEEGFEDIGTAAATAATFLEAFKTVSIINVTFLRVSEDFISFTE